MNKSAEIINSAYPIVQLTHYKNGWEVKRKSLLQAPPLLGRKDKPIVKLSKKSLARLAFTVLNTDINFMTMQTLTYPLVFPGDGTEVKKHLNALLTYQRRHIGKMSYLWFLEFQKRGAPHLHIMTTYPEPTEAQRKHFATIWAGIIAFDIEDQQKVYKVHAHKKSWEKIRSKHGAAGYVLKYALKPYQKTVPEEYRNVGRFWGCSRDVCPKEKTSHPASERLVRKFLLDMGNEVGNWEVIPRFIFKRGEDS